MPPTTHESTKHPQRGRRTVSIDRPPKINGSGIPDSLPFRKKYVAIRKKSFRIDPFFKRGRRVAGRGPCKERWVIEQGTCEKYKNRMQEGLCKEKRAKGWERSKRKGFDKRLIPCYNRVEEREKG